jgi:O-antigen/teichoic acid export membrane protein
MNISKRKVFLDSIIYTLLPKVSFIASLLILPWVTPYLTLKDYGIYGLLMAYITLFQIAMVLGQNVLLQNSFFSHKSNYKLVWRRSFAIMIIAGILSSCVFGLIFYFNLQYKIGSNSLSVFVLICIYLILSPLDTIVINYYVLKEKSLPFAFGAALSGVITTIITLITIKYLKLGYLGWIISLPVNIIISYLFYFRRIFLEEKIIPHFLFKKHFLKTALRVGLPLTPHQLSMYVLGISDRLLLEYFKVPIKSIGLYSQGYNLGSQGNIVTNGVFQALSKKIQVGFRSNDQASKSFIKKLIIIVPLVISSIFFFASLWMKEVFFILFKNPELNQAYPIAIIVLSSYMFWSIYSFFTYPLSISGKTFSISKISLLAASVNIIGNIILIPYYGIWAAVGVTYVSYIVFGFAGLLNKQNRLFLNKYINIVRVCFFLFGINLALFIISYLNKNSGLSLKIAITIIFFCCFGFFLQKVYKQKNYL